MPEAIADLVLIQDAARWLSQRSSAEVIGYRLMPQLGLLGRHAEKCMIPAIKQVNEKHE